MKVLNKVFGGIRMSWVKVIIFAVAAALFTSAMLLIPVFSGTSFHNVGVCFEAWVLFAMFIIMNCEKPVEAMLKTFVFFLISQPLIYLIQVPFNAQGFGIFSYYKYWFLWTLLTIPGAFITWFLKKHNWLSVLVLTAVNVLLLGFEFPEHLETLVKNFPHQLIACIFILAQAVLYIFICLKDKLKRAIAGAAALVIIVLFILFTTDLLARGASSNSYIMGTAPLTIVSCDEGLNAEISGNTVSYSMAEYGTYELVISDGDGNKTTMVIIYDENGVTTENR